MSDHKELCEALRRVSGLGWCGNEAADEIERLRALCDDLWSSIIAAMMLTPRSGGAYHLLRNTVNANRERWNRGQSNE